jgi:hypothetical protein
VRNNEDDSRRAADVPLAPLTVSVIPASARETHSELLRALEEAFPVRFTGSSDADIDTAGAAIVLPGGRKPARLRVPCLTLSAQDERRERGRAFHVEMSRAVGLDRALHGQTLREDGQRPPVSLPVGSGAQVLATAAGSPVWVLNDASGTHEEAAGSAPTELHDHEFLRDRLTAGRFWSLLPIVHFLKRITFGLAGPSERHRACFVIDDPNVRWGSYGYVRFADLARDARECGYHVALATIPLDLLLPGGRAAGLLGSELSLAVHGSDHLRGELGRHDDRDTERLVRSAVARVARFERREGVRVDRVMCPPHGTCGAATLRALFRAGFFGLAASRPFAWDGFADHRRWRLGGWLPAQMAAGGLPVIPRYPLGRNLDDLVFRALLGLPLVMYCHHGDLSDGFEPFRTAAARVADLGAVEWMPLASVARNRVRVREQDGLAEVTLFSRDARLSRPEAPRLRVEVPRVFDAADRMYVSIDGERHSVAPRPDGGAGITVANRSSDRVVRIRLLAPEPLGRAPAWEWYPRPWPVARRVMTETRDRLLPILRP